MLTPAGSVTPGYVVRRTGRTRRVARPSSPRAARPDDDVSMLLGTQWPGPSQAQSAGWPALAQAVLACAVLDSGLLPRRGPVAQRDRWSAARYLLEANDRAISQVLEVPWRDNTTLPCCIDEQTACHGKVRAVIRLAGVRARPARVGATPLAQRHSAGEIGGER